MADLKEVKGKNQLDDLSPGFWWEVGLVATHGNTKYSRGNWHDGVQSTYVAAIMRHLLKYSAGTRYDAETGLHHMCHVARSAEFIHWLDEGPSIPTRTCQCPYCLPIIHTNGHSTATRLGS